MAEISSSLVWDQMHNKLSLGVSVQYNNILKDYWIK